MMRRITGICFTTSESTMSGASSNVDAWYTRLEPASVDTNASARTDDPRLGEVIEVWRGEDEALLPGRPVLIGFPEDEGVRRNHGRPGAAQAPGEIRRWLRRLTSWDARRGTDLASPAPLDAGNIKVSGALEDAQAALGEVIAGVLGKGAIPVVLGGGHETAFGQFLGYVGASRRVSILNFDAHLDVRPLIDGQGHSGSPFRQALEHPSGMLARYVCLGAQPHAVSREHIRYLQERGGRVVWAPDLRPDPVAGFDTAYGMTQAVGCPIVLSVDADVVRSADVPGVSAPNPVGLTGPTVAEFVRRGGRLPLVTSMELVEVNPAIDRDGQSARWAALVIWNFLAGLAERKRG
jgi:formiminoglutamase